MSKRIEKQKLVTPTLRVKYNGLSRPYHFKKDGKEDVKGKYSVTLVGNPADLSSWLEDMDAVNAELLEELFKKEGKKLKLTDNVNFETEVEKETGEETGNIMIKLQHNAKGFDPKTNKEWVNLPKVFDSKGKPVAEDIIAKVGRGSLVRCTFNAVAYVTGPKAGVKWELRATQLIKPEWYEGGSTNDFAGQEVEDGFSVEDVSGDSEF